MKAIEINVNLPKKQDDHPVAMLVQIASRYNCRVYMESNKRKVNAKSIMGMMALGLDNGSDLKVYADGDDEDQALEAIKNYIGGEN